VGYYISDAAQYLITVKAIRTRALSNTPEDSVRPPDVVASGMALSSVAQRTKEYLSSFFKVLYSESGGGAIESFSCCVVFMLVKNDIWSD
jgi:hypothetical protein